MNNLSHTIRRFNRFELKYLLTLKQAAQFKSHLRAYLIPDEHGSDNGHYTNTNLYYDSPDFRCYQEKLDGIKFRRKLRLRSYLPSEELTEETPIFVEIKQRIDRVTQKRRIVLPYRHALLLCNNRQVPDCTSSDQPTAEEIYVFLWQYNLLPASLIRYKRQAFIGTDYDIGLRVTFDTDLSFQPHTLRLHEGADCLPMLDPNLVVMEIKVNERIPYWLTDLIAGQNVSITRMSKYCLSIQAAQRFSLPRWRIPLAEESVEALSSSPSLFHYLERKMEIGRN